MKDVKRGIAVLTLLAALNACTISKDVTKPVAVLPDHYRNEQETDSVGIGELPWKMFYTDSLLQALIDTGLARNYDLNIALNNIEASSLQLRQAKWGNIPEAALQLSASSASPADNSLNGANLKTALGKTHIENYSASLFISWEADIWGKVKNQKRAALAAYLQTWEARRAIQTTIVAAIAQGYYHLLVNDRQMEIAEKNLRLTDSTLNLVRLQYEAGDVTIVAVQQAEAQRLTAAEIIPLLQQARLIEENALSILTGGLPNAIRRSPDLPLLALAQSFATGVPSAMLSRRPDVKIRELELVAANAQVGIAKAQMYPSLRITAAGGIETFKISNWFSFPASLFGAAAASITQPLLHRRVLRTQHQVAQVQRNTAVLRFRQTVLTAVGEVSDALAQVEKLQQRLEIASQRLNILQAAVRNAQLLFQNGQATYLEVIIAQASLLQTNLDFANIMRARLDASIELYRSLGGGWK
jgi:outer membrane protein, multidrug efflux system